MESRKRVWRVRGTEENQSLRLLHSLFYGKLTSFLFFLARNRNTNTRTAQKQHATMQGVSNLSVLEEQKDIEEKREMARRLLEGDGVDKDEAKAVLLLEDCVAHGDADAMVMLAKCCALARGMEHNVGRAEALVSEAAEKGNDEARFLLQLINDWKGKESKCLRTL